MPQAAERMSRVDTAWLRMDNDVNLMMIVGIWLLATPVSINAVRARVVDKLLTGFDAPPCTYLYIDKKMQDHGLFQAICRTNRLDGDITVTVVRKLPNGNLFVRGQKWITINQSREFVRLQGMVRPFDVGPDNSVPSWRVADAEIAYGGRGTLANANQPGWLHRFFNAPLGPF